jgi:membrane-bound inhibitor of C-type lysozyme
VETKQSVPVIFWSKGDACSVFNKEENDATLPSLRRPSVFTVDCRTTGYSHRTIL